jgi:hypothetical protein
MVGPMLFVPAPDAFRLPISFAAWPFAKIARACPAYAPLRGPEHF